MVISTICVVSYLRCLYKLFFLVVVAVVSSASMLCIQQSTFSLVLSIYLLFVVDNLTRTIDLEKDGAVKIDPLTRRMVCSLVVCGLSVGCILASELFCLSIHHLILWIESRTTLAKLASSRARAG